DAWHGCDQRVCAGYSADQPEHVWAGVPGGRSDGDDRIRHAGFVPVRNELCFQRAEERNGGSAAGWGIDQRAGTGRRRNHECVLPAVGGNRAGIQGGEQQLLRRIWEQWRHSRKHGAEIGHKQFSRERLVVWAKVSAGCERLVQQRAEYPQAGPHPRSVRLLGGRPNQETKDVFLYRSGADAATRPGEHEWHSADGRRTEWHLHQYDDGGSRYRQSGAANYLQSFPIDVRAKTAASHRMYANAGAVLQQCNRPVADQSDWPGATETLSGTKCAGRSIWSEQFPDIGADECAGLPV